MTSIFTRRVLPREAGEVRRELKTLQRAAAQGGLALGARGPAVEALQSQLKAAGVYRGPVNGRFDAATETALRAFQEARNLNETGELNRGSARGLGRVNLFVEDRFETPAVRGQSGSDVRAAERHLAKLGFLDESEVDGKFDRDTLAAVHAFRERDGQVPDGLNRIGGLFYRELRKASANAGAASNPRDPAGNPGKESLLIATVNDDFTDRKTNLRRIDADIKLVQEGKNSDYDKALGDRWGVHQGERGDKAGSAVVWDKDTVDAGKRGYALGVKPQGAEMLTRWISFTDVRLDGKTVRMISVHRPPKRFSRLWDDFDANLAKFVKSTKGPVIIGMDANQVSPRGLAKATGLKWHAPEGSIDGFLTSANVEVKDIRRLAKGTSDHHPVVARFSLKD